MTLPQVLSRMMEFVTTVLVHTGVTVNLNGRGHSVSKVIFFNLEKFEPLHAKSNDLGFASSYQTESPLST